MNNRLMDRERAIQTVRNDATANSKTESSPLVPQIGYAMHGEPLRTEVTITNPQGFHMRPQSAFAQAASKFESQVYLYNSENERFDGKSPFSLLGILAEQGSQITLEVSGGDQQEAFKALVHLLNNLSQFESETSEANEGSEKS